MLKKKRDRKAIKAVKKAVRKAVRNGIAEAVVERAVKQEYVRVAKRKHRLAKTRVKRQKTATGSA